MRPRKSVVERVLPGEAPAPRPNIRLRVVGLLVVGLFSLMVVRLWYLQVINTAAYSQKVTANQLRPVEEPAPRGLILDRSGTPLVTNTVTQDITLSRLEAQQHPQVIAQLAALLGMAPQQVQAQLNNNQYSPYKPVPVLTNAPMQDIVAIKENPSAYPGVTVVADTQRSYPQGETAVQTLGYVGQIHQKTPGYQLGDQIGLSGLEAQYESALRGQPGLKQVEVDAHGQVVGAKSETAPTPGGDLVTNLDLGLQQTLENALTQELKSLDGTTDPVSGLTIQNTSGAAVALDPQTGAVLALASEPSYDPNWWVGGITTAHYQELQNPSSNYPLLNRAIDGLYVPGSTFKLATATAALKDGIWSLGQYYNDTGSYLAPGCTPRTCTPLHDNDGEVGGLINITQAITISSDTFFYNLGAQFWGAYKNGNASLEDGIQNVANAYGYGEQTGIDLPGETVAARVDSPQVVAKEHAQDPAVYPNGTWYTGNNIEMAFGQGGTVITPIEQAVAYATFANGGTRYQPQIAAGVVSPDGKVVKTFPPKVVGHVDLPAADRAAMLAGFEGVVNNPKGTAYSTFQGFPLNKMPLAGKTGTGSINNGEPTSWFVGWQDTANPQYVICAVIANGGYGSSAAGPVVRAGFQYLVDNPVPPVQLAPPPGTGSPTTTAPGTTTTTGGATTTTAPAG